MYHTKDILSVKVVLFVPFEGVDYEDVRGKFEAEFGEKAEVNFFFLK